MFFIYLRRNSDLCHLQHKLIGFYNPYEKCLQRGTDIEQSAIRLYRVNIAKLKSADKKVFQKN